jgi:membrane-bound lytic murein transglycosylase D
VDDNPIAAALDSFATKKFLDKFFTPANYQKNNKFHYSSDSIPRFDDFVYEARLSKLDAVSPFDLGFKSEVRPYIELYAMRRRNLVSRMLAMSQLYYPMFEEVLDRYNLPLELKHLAVIESALNPMAKSRVGATGLWQFMYQTGKLYGLSVSSYIDERCDPYKATVAAAEYLQFLYNMFHDWQMVLAAYNAGPGTINRAIRRSGGKKTYWEIRNYLPKETQAYVPAFIAANYIMNFHAEHNIYSQVPKKSYFELDTVVMREPLTFEQLSKVLELPVEELQYFNPMYKKNVIPSGGHVLTLPKTKIGQFISNEENIYASLRLEADQQKLLAETTIKEKQVYYTVRKSDKLSTIARKHGVTVADLKTWNFIGKKGIRPGRKLVIYIKEKPQSAPMLANNNNSTDAAPVSTQVETAKDKASILAAGESKSTNGIYKVKKGDTLYGIARKHNMSLIDLLKLNNLKENASISVGQKIIVANPRG